MVEAGFFLLEGLANDGFAGFEFREDAAHLGDESFDEGAEEWLVARESELTAVSHGAAQDSTKDIVSAVVAGHDAIGDRETECAEVVGDHAEGDRGFHFLVECRAVGAELGVNVHIALAAEFFELAEDRGENIGGVVRGFFREIGEALGVLDDRARALEAHAGVDMLGGQFAECAIGFGVVLNEDEVPNFDAEVGVVVDELALRVAVRSEVNMQLRAGAAGAGLAHHPEVVLHVTIYDVYRRIDSLRAEECGPDIPCFLVELAGVAGLRCVDRCVEAVGRKAPAFDDELPCPLDRFGFEIVSKRPVSEHLEKGVVVGVVTDILEVVMFAAGADALLCVGRAGRIVGGFFDAEKIGHEGIHAGVGEKQSGRLRQQRCRGHDAVLFLAEEIEE